MWDAIGLVVNVIVYAMTTLTGMAVVYGAPADEDRWPGLVMVAVGTLGLFAEIGR